MNLALAQYPIDFHESWDAYARKLSSWVNGAADLGARVLVFPEYASLELASLLPGEVQRDVTRQLPALQPLLPAYLELHRSLAVARGVCMLAGSFPVAVGDKYLNRAFFFGPDGNHGVQDKLVMTRFEAERWGVSAGTGLTLFETEWGRIGVNVCYDAEFPQLARALAGAGADLLLLPSATEAITGYHRVEVGGRARALENQIYVAHAPLVGEAPWNEAVDLSVGAAGLYGPVDHGFSENGVLAVGTLNAPGWVHADLDLAALREVREAGTTLNARDWPQAQRQAAGEVVTVTL